MKKISECGSIRIYRKDGILFIEQEGRHSYTSSTISIPEVFIHSIAATIADVLIEPEEKEPS